MFIKAHKKMGSHCYALVWMAGNDRETVHFNQSWVVDKS